MDEDREQATARIDRAIDALNVTIRDIRNFIFGLRPELLESADLVAGLSTLVDEFRVNTMIDIELRVGAGPVELPLDARAQLLHIAREALSNAARHSGATHVDVSIDSEGDEHSLTVVDNGRGFDPGAVGGAGHFGLVNIAARATSVGGDLAIESAPGAGTRIIVRIPAVPADKETRGD